MNSAQVDEFMRAYKSENEVVNSLRTRIVEAAQSVDRVGLSDSRIVGRALGAEMMRAQAGGQISDVEMAVLMCEFLRFGDALEGGGDKGSVGPVV